MLLSRGVFRGGWAMGGFCPPPLKKIKKCKPFLGKNPEYAFKSVKIQK